MISAPKKKLKQLQLWVLETILNPLPVEENIHGFIKKHSILTNAQPHLQQDIVINIDLKDFFPSISYKHVKGLFRKLGYSEQYAILFALICTQAETDTVEMDGVTYYVQTNRRFLPQGSPASPAISNLIAYNLDRRIKGLAKKYNFTYTRYADDLTFSTSRDNEKHIAKFLYFLKDIIHSEGFTLHPDKTQIMRKGGLQKVTGIVVNEKQNIQRNELRKFRALLHNIEANGWKDQKWGNSVYLPRTIEGYINFVKMVNPEKGKKFEEQLLKIVYKHGYPTEETGNSIQPESITTSPKK
ncbi:MAG: reverse transcriptase family protein [Tannerellaceae bacterium]|nr:reverse transcriptase family protein [Tannerellaceae bacterium]